MSSSIWRSITIKKVLGGVRDVTEEEKDAIIEKAASQWEKMGLTQNEMAFGIATMNVESGFNPHVKGMSDTEYGLGQFNDLTWRPAVAEYNRLYRSPSEPRIYPDLSKDDPDAQIKAMGAWIKKVWKKVEAIAGDPKLKDYGPIDVAYGLWHEGINKSINGLKTYLDKAGKDGYKDKTAQIDFCLCDTYVKAHDALDVRDILSTVNKRIFGDFSGTARPQRQLGRSGSNSGETLRRDVSDYTKVWRINKDGSRNRCFVSKE